MTMNPEDNYIEINKASWNNKTDVHLKSEFCNVDGFLDSESSLNNVELDLLEDIRGKTILHLQCHFGQDSISLSRRGTKVTGIDLSDKSILRTNEFAESTKENVNFICCDRK